MAWDRLAHEYMLENDACLLADNARNIIPPFDAAQATESGITYSASNSVLSVSGSSTGWFIRIAGNSTGSVMPSGLEAGETYFFWLNAPDALRLCVYAWPGGTRIFETSSFGWFTIPAGTTGVQIRVRVPNGQSVPSGTVVYPYIGKSIPNRNLQTLLGFKNPAPMLTIIDDDGNSKFYTKLLPVIIEKNVPITSAVVCGNINSPSDHNSMTWDQVVECYQKGAEIVSHTLSHLTGDVAETLTEPEIEADYRKARHTLASHGIHSNNILVYAGNSGNNANCVEAAKRVYDYAIHSAGNTIIKQDNFKPYYIQRYGVSTSEFVPASGQTVGTNPKSYIDSLVTSGGWMVWMLHTSSGDWTDDQVNGIKASIDYAVGQGVQIVTCEYALKQFVKV